MIDLMFGVFLGYLIGSTVGSAFSKTMRRPDKILSWSPDVMAYRPIPPNAKVEAGKSYYLCYEIKGNEGA